SKVAWCLLGSDGEGDWKSWVRWWSGEKWERWDSGVWRENIVLGLCGGSDGVVVGSSGLTGKYRN
nr:hypothetical protein [Tanacetum cinerariifolium]